LEQGRQAFEQFYTSIALDSAAKFGTVLRNIASSSGPALFHCQGGRDRTGITAAMLLEILGVPRQTILEDYVLSTVYLNERPTAPAAAPASEAEARAEKLYSEVIQLQPRYIAAVFQEIAAKHGSFDRYRRSALQLTDADVLRLKSRLLE
jgi:protein-tyrosine phosphatase